MKQKNGFLKEWIVVLKNKNLVEILVSAGIKSKFRPVSSGDHKYCEAPHSLHPAAPCTISIVTSLVGVISSNICDCNLPAGDIASKNGSAMLAPIPRSIVRLEMWFPVIKFISSSNV